MKVHPILIGYSYDKTWLNLYVERRWRMKQILQYIWIEKSGCIENQEFNFTNRIRFHYNQEKQMITAEENDEYYSNFFGTNTELTCVVGL